MSKGLQESGRFVTAIIMESLQLYQEHKIWFTPDPDKSAEPFWLYEEPQDPEQITFGLMCEKVAAIKYAGGPFVQDWIQRGWEVPAGWGKYSQREYDEFGNVCTPVHEFIGPTGKKGPLFKAMKKEAADQLKVLMKRDDCPYTVKGVAEELIPQHDDVLMIKESCENWTPDRPLY